MAKRHSPRSGSMQFWPRKRARRIYPKIRSWSDLAETKLLGFAGYKVGMTQIPVRDNSTSVTKGQIISIPATIIECPPLKPLSLRFYQKSDYGLKIISEVKTKQSLDKELSRKILIAKKTKEQSIPEIFDRVTILVYTQPKLTSIKKKPEIFEIEISSPAKDFLTGILEKDITIEEVFNEGQIIDIHAVTKGKGFQGPVKRFGVRLRQKKSEKTKRGPASLGPWNQQQHTMYRVAHAGQMGFHTRTDYNKLLLKISSNPEEINNAEGFKGYGNVKSNYVLIKGSIPGVRKRLVRLQEPIRKRIEPIAIEIQ